MNTPEPTQERMTIQEQLDLQQQALTQIYASVEKTRKYILWTGIMNAVVFIIPLIIAIIMISRIIGTFTSSIGDLGAQVPPINAESLQESFEKLEELGFR